MVTAGEDDYDRLYKIVLVGDVSVGKTHLLSRYMRDELPKAPAATIGVEFATRTVRLPVGSVKAQIWDTAGQEAYRAITRAHYRRAAGAVLVYDITRQSTFQSCAKWVQEVREGASPDAVVHLVGNKADLVDHDPSTREVYREVAEEFARSHGLLFCEASAVTAQNVQRAFEQLLTEIYSRFPPKPAGGRQPGAGEQGGLQIVAGGRSSGAGGCDTSAC
mmetsp:Transcript_69347/g.194443  ORF Transcript_69347/g.194443 Transcript_69347/m.194443 type:complete len:219 (+) Transcript_69347:110-766(+)